MFGYLFAVIGFLVGLGFARYPLARMLGRERSHAENEEGGIGRYFGLCTDHKVVGIQYLIGIGIFFFIGGLNAMLIRAELLRPSPQLFSAENYLTLVGLHGTMMMGIMTSGVLGPFANYFVPLMIGARRMAFPRVEAVTFWLLMAAGTILVTTLFFGGFPTGWTGYAPLNVQANYGFDSYIFFFALVGLSMMLLGLNMIATIVTMRAPGLTWRRLPIFCWGALSTSILMVLAAPVLIAALLDGRLRPRRADLVLPLQRGGQSVPVPEPVLVLRPSGGLRARPARVRNHPRAAAGIRPQTALGLPDRGGGDPRRDAAQLLRLAAPPLRQRPQLLAAALLHVLHRGDLGSDRAGVPGRDGDAVESAHPLHGADAVLPCLVLQLLHRRRLRRLSFRRSQRRRHPRQLLRHGPLPLHDHGRPGLLLLCGDLLLGAEDVRHEAERKAGEDPLLDDVHRLQLDLCAALRARADGASRGGW